ncbi:AEL244Wp [Eremothecium gossypii ATCC 10895]|uniref:AEL244Wp n=1 Tax=Eremothecium gossypii (strain ATCC 10895 / CBS 109.51 / FGSC 9923 / NRRL Y-1056) TaxID=284811 RepID=Q758K6_EREGS|nr:AEL244Wp [Eremothecium gossypii ATCC 10895]AAS52441.1 AEL244Wp [Eremothecium gossypii ATCC 10895]AEY96740.1 FAEL244Wp [Eremothecium gossypii FDAG1]
MGQEKFVIPGNITLLQALTLLHSIVSAQFENTSKDMRASLASAARKDDTLLECQRALEETRGYLIDGSSRIKTHYRIDLVAGSLPEDVQGRIDDLRILEQDIKTSQQALNDMLGDTKKRVPQVHRHAFSSIFRKTRFGSDRRLQRTQAAEDAEAHEVAELKRQRELQEDRKRQEELEREKRAKEEEDKRLEEAIKKHLEMELAQRFDRPRSEGTTQHNRCNGKFPPRLSLDMRGSPKVELPVMRRSLDLGASYSTKLEGSSINKAALLAWYKDKEKNVKTDPSKKENKERRVPPPPAKYEYTKPVIRRPQLKFSQPQGSRNKVKAKVLETVPPDGLRSPSPKRGSNSDKSPVIESSPNPTTDSNSPQEISLLEKNIKDVMRSLKGVDTHSCEQIINEILVVDYDVRWEDIAGLTIAKKCLKETVVYPFLRPDLFRGLREPISGMLLFGPPGTGKTMIARAVATESNSTFFCISASSLLSKYLGESEKLVKALFYLAKRLSPSIIFIDEIDSLLTSRSDNENESSRRIKTELLVQWSSLTSATAKETREGEEARRVLVLAATNLPWAIDDAAIRRFSRRLYIPLPEYETRLYHLKKLMALQKNELSESDFQLIARMTEGYSGSDITALAKEAAMEPIRELGDNLINVNFDTIRSVLPVDFHRAMVTIKKSVSPDSLIKFDNWATEYGSIGS